MEMPNIKWAPCIPLKSNNACIPYLEFSKNILFVKNSATMQEKFENMAQLLHMSITLPKAKSTSMHIYTVQQLRILYLLRTMYFSILLPNTPLTR